MTLGLKQDAKKELIMALSGSEVDEAKPFDSVVEWLKLLINMYVVHTMQK